MIRLHVLSPPTVTLQVQGQAIAMGRGRAYEGPYAAEPRFVAQTLPTAERYLSKDITIDAIRVAYTSNDAGGNTVFIGRK